MNEWMKLPSRFACLFHIHHFSQFPLLSCIYNEALHRALGDIAIYRIKRRRKNRMAPEELFCMLSWQTGSVFLTETVTVAQSFFFYFIFLICDVLTLCEVVNSLTLTKHGWRTWAKTILMFTEILGNNFHLVHRVRSVNVPDEKVPIWSLWSRTD